MNKFKITIDGKNYEVTVNETDQNMAKVEVNGNSYNVRYESEATVVPPMAHKQAAPAASKSAQSAPAAQPTAARAAGAATIKAPLPGTITSINVSVGAQVKRGDVLVVMEAMKMENNIMANKDGQVKAIRVTAGQTVAQDEPLIDLE